MGLTECFAQSHQLDYCVHLLLRVHSAQCCLASSCLAGVGLQFVESVPSVQLCCCAAAVAVADRKLFDAGGSWLETSSMCTG